MFLLVPLAFAGPTPVSYVGLALRIGMITGAPASVTVDGVAMAGELTATLYSPTGATCVLTWSALAEGVSPATVEPARWLWTSAAWRLSLGTPAATGACDSLDEDVWGTDPAATFAAAGWHLAFGPARPMMGYWANVGDELERHLTVYMWMDGAKPYPIGLIEGWALDEAGAATSQQLDFTDANMMPDGWYIGQGGVML